MKPWEHEYNSLHYDLMTEKNRNKRKIIWNKLVRLLIENKGEKEIWQNEKLPE